MNPCVIHRNETSPFALPADGWHQIAPLGEHAHPESGCVQMVDRAAVESMARRFQTEAQAPNYPGLLVDFDHFSYDPDKPTEAAGWIQALEARVDGLWARIRWSAAGETALREGRYRLISPVWLARDCEILERGEPCPAPAKPTRLRPLRLDGAGLTNHPNLKGIIPLSNRRDAEASPAADPGAPPAGAPNTKTKGTMKSVCKTLGLSPEAAEEAVLAEIVRLQQDLKTAQTALEPMQNRTRELETAHAALLETQVENDLDRHASRFLPAARDKWRAALRANRANTLELLTSLPEPPTGRSGPQPMHNRQLAKTPDAGASEHSTDAQRLAVQEYKNRRHCSWQQAWEAVRAERPELFRTHFPMG